MASRDYKTPRSNVPVRSGSPLLVGIVIGILVGLAAALAVALYLFKVPAPFMPREGGGKPVAEESAKPAAPMPPSAETKPEKGGAAVAKPAVPGGSPVTGTQEGEKQRFDFYKILPGTEEAAKDRDAKRPDRKAPAVGTAPTPPVGAVDLFYLQAGAFQNAADADNLKARLALAGIEAKVLTAELPEGKVWHRVRVGPFRDVAEVGRVRDRLKQNQIDATLIKEKGSPE